MQKNQQTKPNKKQFLSFYFIFFIIVYGNNCNIVIFTKIYCQLYVMWHVLFLNISSKIDANMKKSTH